MLGLHIRSSSKTNKLKVEKKLKCKKVSIKVIGNNNSIHLGYNFSGYKSRINVTGSNNKIVIGDGFNNSGKVVVSIIGNNNKVLLGKNITVISGLNIYNHENGKNCNIIIGDNSSFYKTEIHNYDYDSSVKIGNDCMFSYDTVIYNTDGHAIVQNGKIINKATELVIGDHVWVGWGCTILKNSYVSNNCICGRAALVCGKFSESNCAIAGVPAKIIKRNVNWSRKSVNEYLETAF